VALLAALLAGLAVAGGWNYQRNVQLERAEQGKRPFSGYADADLRALADAYRAEAETLRKRYEATRSARPEARRRVFVSDGVREFERVQRHAERSRDAAADLAEREARLSDIEKELATRAELGSGFELHLRRLTRI
jgi:hypothetical protein